MSVEVRDFSNIGTQAIIKFFSLQGKSQKEIHAILTGALGEHAPSYDTFKNWVAHFKHDDFSTCAAPCPGQPK
jgi:transposase